MDKSVNKVIVAFVSLIVLFTLYAALVPEGITAGNALNSTAGFSFGSFFASGGIVWILISVGLLLVVLKTFKVSGK